MIERTNNNIMVEVNQGRRVMMNGSTGARRRCASYAKELDLPTSSRKHGMKVSLFLIHGTRAAIAPRWLKSFSGNAITNTHGRKQSPEAVLRISGFNSPIA